jgi:hypothetical protein
VIVHRFFAPSVQCRRDDSLAGDAFCSGGWKRSPAYHGQLPAYSGGQPGEADGPRPWLPSASRLSRPLAPTRLRRPGSKRQVNDYTETADAGGHDRQPHGCGFLQWPVPPRDSLKVLDLAGVLGAWFLTEGIEKHRAHRWDREVERGRMLCLPTLRNPASHRRRPGAVQNRTIILFTLLHGGYGPVSLGARLSPVRGLEPRNPKSTPRPHEREPPVFWCGAIAFLGRHHSGD